MLIPSSGSSVSSILLYQTFASRSLNGSALSEGIDWITRNKSWVEKQSVEYFFPSTDINFSCMIFSYTSLLPFLSLFFKLIQYLFGIIESVKISMMSTIEKYQKFFIFVPMTTNLFLIKKNDWFFFFHNVFFN